MSDKALEYLVKAAQKAANAFANREAVALYEQALDVCRRARAAGQEGLAIARRLGDRLSEAAAFATMGFASAFGHDFNRAIDDCRTAIRIATDIDAKAVIANAYVTTAVVHSVTARLEESAEETEKAVDLSEAAHDISTLVMAKGLSGTLLNWQGNYREAWRRQEIAVARAREHRVMFPLFLNLWWYGLSLAGGGRYDESITILEEGLAVCEKSGEEIMRHRILNTLGWVYLECGDLDVAVEFNRRGAEAARKRGDAETIANSELNLGDAYLAKGDLALAQEFLDGVHGLVRRPTTSEWMKWRYSTHLFASLAELALARGDRDPARRFADECLEIASRTQAKRYLVKGWRLRGQIGLARGDTTEAEQSLRQALTIAQSIQNPPQLWSTHAALGELHRARGEREAARQLMHEKAVFAPIWEIGDLHGVGPRVGDPAIGYVPGYPFSAPYEDVKLKPK